MLTTLRRDRRSRRQADLSLEPLDDRLVLSVAGGGAVAQAAGTKAALLEHRQEVQVAKHEAKHEAKQDAKLARVAVEATVVAPASTGASASRSASSAAAARAAVTTSNSTPRPSRQVPAAAVTTASTGTGTSTSSSSTLPANVAAALQSLYQEYVNAGGGSSFTPSQPSDNLLEISGASVGVNLKMGSTGDFNTFHSQLQSDGMQVTSSSAAYGLVDGMLPISELPAIAQAAASVTPMYRPVFH
jgi:hypothetical protein